MITIIDYNAGNLRSVQRACLAVDVPSTFTADPDLVRRAERVIFPGVGAAKAAMDNLVRSGLDVALREVVARGVPVLGICVGAQIILDRSEEGDVAALGLIPGTTRRFRLEDRRNKIPHMGWNAVRVERPHHLLAGLREGDELYFVHSYYPDPVDVRDVFATTEHEVRFCSALGRDNLFATQFHPEKSGAVGLDILRRFATWEGTC